MVGTGLALAEAAMDNSSFRKGAAKVLVMAAVGAMMGFTATHGGEAMLASATKNVGVALQKELEHSTELRDFLGTHHYVYVDRKGNLVGTNRGRILGIGRIRLESHKILTGKYKE